MKKIAALIFAFCFIFVAYADEAFSKGGWGRSSSSSKSYSSKARSTSVRGYYRKSGKFVRPHKRTLPNETRRDNWSTKGNVNPYTGKAGTKNP